MYVYQMVITNSYIQLTNTPNTKKLLFYLKYLTEDMSTNALLPGKSKVNGRRRCQELDVRVRRNSGLHAGRDRLTGGIAPVDNASAVVRGLEAKGQVALQVTIERHLFI